MVHAQAGVSGRVLGDSAQVPVVGAEVRAVRPGVVATTDSAGRFSLRNLPAGQLVIITRALGFRPDTSFVDLDPDETLSRDVRLARSVTSLNEVRVNEPARSLVSAKLMAFEERRRSNTGGHFMDSTVIAKWENRKTGDLLSTLSGVDIQRAGSASYVTGPRGPRTLRGGADARERACYMDVYVDGVPVATVGTAFDVNSVGLNHVAAIEVYTGPANTPAQYNRTSKVCGVVLIWTK
jgi:hypothetical protein